MLPLLVAVTTIWIGLAAFDFVQLMTLPWVREAEPCDERRPTVTVVVAALDEAAMAARCVRSLLSLDYPDYDVVWVDDHSTDGTPEIVEREAGGDPRLTTLVSKPRPEGWVGKCWAMQEGTRIARGEWLLLVDADTVYDPACLEAAMTRALNGNLDFVSLIPGYEGFGLLERVVAPAFVWFLGTFYPFWWVNRHPRRVLAWGGFLLVRRSLYERIGGHEAARDTVLEDLAMARAAKRAGAGVWTGTTDNLVRTRQYGTRGDLWEGYGKQAFILLDHSPAQVAALALAVPLLTLVPPLGLGLGLSGGPGSYLWLSGISLVLTAMTASGVLAVMKLSQVWIATFPIGLLVYAMIAVDSMRKGLLGRTSWRGRRYQRR